MKPKYKNLMCSICQRPIAPEGTWLGGNNAQPVNAGRCCRECNETIVLPARIRLAQQWMTRAPHPQHNYRTTFIYKNGSGIAPFHLDVTATDEKEARNCAAEQYAASGPGNIRKLIRIDTKRL
jgi:hypothetical protein